jgi:stage II sporulation protein D
VYETGGSSVFTHKVTLLAALALALLAPCQEPPRVPTIRVLVRATAEPVSVRCRGPVEILRSGRAPGAVLPELQASTVGLKDGRILFGGRPFDAPQLTIRMRDGSRPLELGARSYAGDVHFFVAGAELRVVNEIDMERYVQGVVGAEIGSGAPLEAMKVQAVCVRSFAIGRLGGFREEKGRPEFDVSDTTRDQVYVGVPPRDSTLLEACEATAGMYVMYRKRFVTTYFSSSCGGHTLGVGEWSGAAAIPPLSGVRCGFCDDAPNGSWEVRLTLPELAAKLSRRVGGKAVLGAVVVERTPSDRAGEVLVDHAGGRARMTGAEFAQAVGARSNHFTLARDGASVVVRGRGYGHGVGLCQVGALRLASKGKDFRDILNHYFPQHELVVHYGPHRGRR